MNLKRKRKNMPNPNKAIYFTYRNYQGKVNQRKVVPQKIWFGHSEYHDNAQWFMRGFDLSKNDWRDFALTDISDLKGPTE